MGLDISLETENYHELCAEDKIDYFRKHSLSRTFCNFICRYNTIEGEEPELDQIGVITGIDISSIYGMNDYPDPNELYFLLDTVEDEAEKQEILNRREALKRDFPANINNVTETINNLIIKLSDLDNLPMLFEKTERDTLDRHIYFRDFNQDTGDGYINNNFGQDLRNFKSFLEFAKSKGATKVWFSYG